MKTLKSEPFLVGAVTLKLILIHTGVLMRYVFYHKSCPDGFTAAWAAWLKFGDSAIYEGKNHGDDLGELEEKSEIYILDFSWPAETLWALHDAGHKIQLLDHHKTAKEQLGDCGFAHVDMTCSGARLAWDYFHPEKIPPALVHAVEDRDLWRFSLPDTKKITALLHTFEWTFENMSKFSDSLSDPSFVKQGEVLLRYWERFTKSQAKKARLAEIGGYRVRCVNAVSQISEICHEMLALYPDTPFAASFFVSEQGNFVFSLRGRGDFDVSQVAVRYGGGGHFSAAGFSSRFVEWAEELPAEPKILYKQKQTKTEGFHGPDQQ